jgi:hypothetical protein
LNAAARSDRVLAAAGPDFPHKVKYIVTRMKLFTIVSVPFSCTALKATVQKIFKSMHLHDHEGIALSMLSLTVISADIVDSVTTFVNAALETASKQAIPAFSALGLPLGYTITTVGTISRIIQIAKTCHLYNSLKKVEASEEKRKQLRQFLENKFGLTLDEKMLSKDDMAKLIEKKNADLLRAAPPEAVAELRELYLMLRQDHLNMDEVSKKLDHISSLLIKKMMGDAIGIGANMVAFSALSLFTLGAAGAAPFILLTVSFAIRISGAAFQDLYKP